MSESATVDSLSGASGDDILTATEDGSKLVGGSGDDTLESGSGDDVLNGGSGTDIAYYDADVQIFLNDDGVLSLYDEKGNMIVFDAGEFGTDTLKSIEIIQFNNYTYHMDGNNAVLAVDDFAEIGQDAIITNFDVVTNDIDLDGDALTVTEIDATGSTGIFTLHLDGSISYNPAGGFDYLADGEIAEDSITYTVTDGESTTTGVFTVKITGTNDAPVATDEEDFSVTEDDVITEGQVSATDIDVGDTRTYSLVSGSDVPAGLIFNSDGSYSFDPSDEAYQAGESGDTTTVSFEWIATDFLGATSASDTVTITITHTDDGVPSVDIDGVVTDGYIVGATVFSDEDGSGDLTAGDISTTTDGMGQFSLEGTTGDLFMLGGTDAATGLAFEGTLKAPAGSTSITSLSTLVSDLMDLGQSQADGESAVKAAYGIDASVDILTIDPIQATLSADTTESDAGRTVMGTAAQVLNSVIQIASLIVGASSGSISQADAMNATFAEIASGINSASAYDLLDPNSVMTLIETVAGTVNSSPEVSLNDISGIQLDAAELITSVNHETQQVLDSATTSTDFLTDLTQVSIVAQAELSEALSTVASDADPATAMAVVTDLYTSAAAPTPGDIQTATLNNGDTGGFDWSGFNVFSPGGTAENIAALNTNTQSISRVGGADFLFESVSFTTAGGTYNVTVTGKLDGVTVDSVTLNNVWGGAWSLASSEGNWGVVDELEIVATYQSGTQGLALDDLSFRVLEEGGTGLEQAITSAEDSVGDIDGIQSTVYTPTSNQITVNTYAVNNGFVIQGDGATKFLNNVEQLTVDNSGAVSPKNFVTLDTDSYGSGASLFDTGVIYYGSSEDDYFKVSSDSWVDTKTSVELYLGDGDDHGEGGSLNDILEGGNGNDVLAGFGGDDIIIGGSGMADHLYGDDLFANGLFGEGADRFVFQAGDTDGVLDLNNDGQLIVGYVDLDFIADFDVNEGDVLDLAGLLSGVTDGLTEDGASLQHLLDFTFNGHSTEIGIDVNGDGVDIATAGTGYFSVASTDISQDQKIILSGQDLTDGGTLSDAQIIDSLLASGSIDIIA